ncbi:MAG TPA: type II toxin-antitoxin system VapC family toxin [Candidatus Acidoferrales bacterium]|nr:type II toxin-antitoxin system VapC family toxin [Candidatus Acidoferrales bacterium]
MAIVSCLVDTNILLRLTRRSDPYYSDISSSVGKLAAQGAILHYCHQNIAELWNAMTRPADRNGLGLTLKEAQRQAETIESGMFLLPDSRETYLEWRRLVVEKSIVVVRVHDARLAACMHVHGVRHILTMNVSDFARFTEVIALHPQSI